jgi:hypothetical protein
MGEFRLLISREFLGHAAIPFRMAAYRWCVGSQGGALSGCLQQL